MFCDAMNESFALIFSPVTLKPHMSCYLFYFYNYFCNLLSSLCLITISETTRMLFVSQTICFADAISFSENIGQYVDESSHAL